MNKRFIFLVVLVVLAAVVRLVPHPPNFAPIIALALFGGACFADRRMALLVPLAAMFLSDLVLGLHSQVISVYVAFVMIAGLGMLLRRNRGAAPLAAAALAGSSLFFVLTNFGVWLLDGLYPLTLPGLVACYAAAVPFFQNTLLGGLFYTGLLFGGLALAERTLPFMRERLPAGTATA